MAKQIPCHFFNHFKYGAKVPRPEPEWQTSNLSYVIMMFSLSLSSNPSYVIMMFFLSLSLSTFTRLKYYSKKVHIN